VLQKLVVGYLLVIAGVISSYVLNITGTSRCSWSRLLIISLTVSYCLVYDMGTLPPIYCMLYPPYAFYRSIYLMGARCGFFACYQWDDFVWPDQVTVESKIDCIKTNLLFFSLAECDYIIALRRSRRLLCLRTLFRRCAAKVRGTTSITTSY